jgi:hypothetical protein
MVYWLTLKNSGPCGTHATGAKERIYERSVVMEDQLDDRQSD